MRDYPILIDSTSLVQVGHVFTKIEHIIGISILRFVMAGVLPLLLLMAGGKC